MRPLLQHASRSLFASLVPATPQPWRNVISGCSKRRVERVPSVCLNCQFRASSVFASRRDGAQSSSEKLQHGQWSRRFSSSRFVPEEKKSTEPSEPIEAPPESRRPLAEDQPPDTTPTQTGEAIPLQPPNPPIQTPETLSIPPAEESLRSESSKPEDTIKRVPVEDLPSHREGQRWDFSKRINEIMDEVLPKLAVVTQKVNTYTGTDYSGIEALRREIEEQERLVKARRGAIDDAKHALDAAHAQRASSQKEVVALLERKHSWSATDLERYMSLIRSEHVNDQAVRDAKDAVHVAENSLEEARAQLEKRERARYHEEQIWSDTIRRNSTWVTFGLMGFNIFLLLLSLVILEPWRRRRIVREIKSALEAQKPVIEAVPAATSTAVPMSQSVVAIEAAIDQAVEPLGQLPEEITTEATSISPNPSTTETDPPTLAEVAEVAEMEEAADTPETLPHETTSPITEPSVPTLEPAESIAAINIPEEAHSNMTWLKQVTTRFQELKSEDLVSVRKRDITAAALMGVAAGWCFSTILYLAMAKSR